MRQLNQQTQGMWNMFEKNYLSDDINMPPGRAQQINDIWDKYNTQNMYNINCLSTTLESQMDLGKEFPEMYIEQTHLYLPPLIKINHNI